MSSVPLGSESERLCDDGMACVGLTLSPGGAGELCEDDIFGGWQLSHFSQMFLLCSSHLDLNASQQISVKTNQARHIYGFLISISYSQIKSP